MNPNFVIRPIQERDLPEILEIAGQTGPGFNSLPKNREVLAEKIARAIDSFSEKIPPAERYYFFVMERVQNHEIIGTAGIEACLGHRWPFYKYKISNLVQVSQTIHQSHRHQILQWVSDHEGATELEALYLKPAYRGEGRGSFLSRSRFLFIAEFLALFADRVVADMRGVSNAECSAPFWEALGRSFIDLSYQEASYLKATTGSQFMVDLLPHDPIYIDFLSEAARNVIGKTHENSTPALYVLEKEGLKYLHYIDMFDAGPTVEALALDLRTVRESQSAIVVDFTEKLSEDPLWLIGNTLLHFRATIGGIEPVSTGQVILDKSLRDILDIEVGDRVRYSLFR